jgi:hypothetical protein
MAYLDKNIINKLSIPCSISQIKEVIDYICGYGIDLEFDLLVKLDSNTYITHHDVFHWQNDSWVGCNKPNDILNAIYRHLEKGECLEIKQWKNHGQRKPIAKISWGTHC